MENFYNKQEVDAKITALKNILDTAIEESITTSDSAGEIPEYTKSLHLRYIDEDEL